MCSCEMCVLPEWQTLAKKMLRCKGDKTNHEANHLVWAVGA